MSIAGMLKGHELFQSMSVEAVERISRFSELKNFEAGQTVFEHGAPGAHLFLLLEGTIDLRLPGEHAELSIAVARVRKGDLFGLSPLLGSDTYTASGYSRDSSSVLAIEARPLRDLLQADCRTGFNIMNQVARTYFNRYMQVLGSLQRVVSDLPLMP